MKTIQCPNPKCDNQVTLDISKSVDANGEVFICPKCGQKIRFTEK